jgi:sugar lactone lactonase YvrE
VPEEQALYRVDIVGKAVRRLVPGTGAQAAWPTPSEVGSLALRTAGGAVLALRTGFALLDLGTGTVEPLADPEPDAPRNRFNDGACDRAGRFWAGTLHDDEVDPVGALHRLDPDRTWTTALHGVVCSNGLGWSPDDRTAYVTDSRVGRIDAFDYDLATGTLSGRRPFVVLEPRDGFPDGLTVDAEGFVWSAVWDGWRLVRYAPDGTVDRVVPMPVQRPTSVALGGPDLRTLYVTSASYGLSPDARAAQPLAGSLFALRTEVPGLPEPRYGG